MFEAITTISRQAQRRFGGAADIEVSAVNRIERAAEDADRGAWSCGRLTRRGQPLPHRFEQFRARRRRSRRRCRKNGRPSSAARCASAAIGPSSPGSSGVDLVRGDDLRLGGQRRRRTAPARGAPCRDRPPDRVRWRRRRRRGARAPSCARGGGGTGGRARDPRCAPSIRPGTSATTKLRSSLRPTTPRFGVSVVKG